MTSIDNDLLGIHYNGSLEYIERDTFKRRIHHHTCKDRVAREIAVVEQAIVMISDASKDTF
jgi:hypothetical protein